MNTEALRHMEKIDRAVRLLKEAEKDRVDDIRHAIEREWENLSSQVKEVTRDVQKTARDIKTAAVEMTKDLSDRAVKTAKGAARSVDKSAHESPWLFVGGAALLGLACGVLATRSVSNRHH